MRLLWILIQLATQRNTTDNWTDNWNHFEDNYYDNYEEYQIYNSYANVSRTTNLWYGNISATLEVSSHHSKFETANMFDDDYETVWVSEYGHSQGSNTSFSIEFYDYYIIYSISLSFPNYYITIPVISIFTDSMDSGLTLQHEWSINDEDKVTALMKNEFIFGVDRLLEFEHEGPPTKEIKIVFGHDCEFVAISDFKIEYEMIDSDSNDSHVTNFRPFWQTKLYVDGMILIDFGAESALEYEIVAVGYCEVCNQDLHLRYQPDSKFGICKMFQLKSQTVCDPQYGLGLAKWQPWHDRIDYLRVDTEYYVWPQFKCLCDGTCNSQTKPSHIIVMIGSACVILSGVIIIYLFYRRKPWKTYDIDADKIIIRGKDIPLVLSKTFFCWGIMSIFVFDWVNIVLDMIYFKELIERTYLEPNQELNQTWIDQRIIFGLVTPSHVYNGLGGVIILSVLKNLTVFVLISGTFNRNQTQYNQTLKRIMLTATTLVVEDAVSSFYQYFYFELYNDIEVWKRRTMMEKTIMNQMFQSLNEIQKQTIWASLNFPLYFPIIKSAFLIASSYYSFYKLCKIFDRKRTSHMCFLLFALLMILMNILRSISIAINSTRMFFVSDNDFVDDFRHWNISAYTYYILIYKIFYKINQSDN